MANKYPLKILQETFWMERGFLKEEAKIAITFVEGQIERIRQLQDKIKDLDSRIELLEGTLENVVAAPTLVMAKAYCEKALKK